MKLNGKVVFITDAASRTGTAIASTFLSEGAVLAANVFPAEREFSLSGCGIVTNADPLSKVSIDQGVRAALDTYGRIDVLVHNNNEVIPAGLESCTDEDFDYSMNINIKSAFLYARAAGAAMKEAGKGCFVFISSIHDEKPVGGAFAYSIAKGALKMLTKEMALDMGPYNIRTNLISMGPMEGEENIFSSDLSPLYEYAEEKIANHRYGTLTDLANAALFFAGDDCTFANGSELQLDGAFLLAYFLRRVYRTDEAAAKKEER